FEIRTKENIKKTKQTNKAVQIKGKGGSLGKIGSSCSRGINAQTSQT
ncbi:hypothetical protein LINPERHAP1_LOCUS24503, partial [Linum perenne]